MEQTKSVSENLNKIIPKLKFNLVKFNFNE